MPTSMVDVFTEQGNLSKLGIGLQAMNIQDGNIDGNNDLCCVRWWNLCKISPSSKVYANEEIHSR